MQASITAIDGAISTPADTTLVAHSASGLVAPIVAGRRQVSELVLVAALMQVPGYSWVAQREAQKSAQHTEFFLMHEPRILVDAQGNWTWRTEDGAKVFYNDCEPADAVCSQDRAVSRDWAIRTAREQFDATIEEFDASHSPFWSRPADLAELLTESRRVACFEEVI